MVMLDSGAGALAAGPTPHGAANAVAQSKVARRCQAWTWRRWAGRSGVRACPMSARDLLLRPALVRWLPAPLVLALVLVLVLVLTRTIMMAMAHQRKGQPAGVDCNSAAWL